MSSTSSDSPLLRPVEDKDGPALARLLGSVFAEFEGCLLDIDAEEPWLRAPRQALEHGWVLEQGGQVLGLVAARVEQGGVVLLQKCYLSRELRGRGLGRLLIERVLDLAHQHRAPAVELWTDTRFVTAHRVYERIGFRATGALRELDDLSATREAHYRLELT